MNKKRRNFILITVSMVVFLMLNLLALNSEESSAVNGVYAEVNQPQILIINSYHLGYGWTDRQVLSLQEALNHSKDHPIYYMEFLDWKRNPYEEHLENMADLILDKYQGFDFDAIITTDDVAMQFAIDHRDELSPDAPIIFTGVFKESAEVRMEGVDNITGIYESIDALKMVEMILTLQPDTSHFYVINDESEGIEALNGQIIESLEAYREKYGYTYESLGGKTYDEIDEVLSDPEPHSVVIVGSFSVDSDYDAVPNEIFVEELAEWLTIPIYSPYEYLLDHGITGGVMTSGDEMAKKAAERTMAIIEGEPISSFRADAENVGYYALDYTYTTKFQLSVERLDVDFVCINKPVTAFETYKVQILATMLLVLILCVFIILLTTHIRSRKKAQMALEMKHRELMEIYESLSESEEELRIQNEELLEQQREINYLSFYDALTKMPNRNAFSLEMTSRMENQYEGKTMMIVISVGDLNDINGKFGSVYADQILTLAAKEIMHLQMYGYYVGRVSGNSFGLIKSYFGGGEGVEQFGEIEALFKQPLNLKQGPYIVEKEVGYAVYPDDGKDFDGLLWVALQRQKKYNCSEPSMSHFN